jgi:MarR family transcriptional regulator for hemolysin
MSLGDEPSPTGEGVGGLGFLLDRVAHSLSRAFADALAPSGLTSTGLGLLTALRRWEPLSQTELAAFLGVERQQILHLVDALEQRGLVERRARPGDRRVWDVSITPAGRRLHDEALGPVREHEQATFAGLTPDQQRQLTELLTALAPAGRYPEVLKPPRRRPAE